MKGKEKRKKTRATGESLANINSRRKKTDLGFRFALEKKRIEERKGDRASTVVSNRLSTLLQPIRKERGKAYLQYPTYIATICTYVRAHH